jgi:hypothetical protein
MHDCGFCDAKRFVADGTKPGWIGGKADTEGEKLGFAVSCLFQVCISSYGLE